MAKKTNSAAAAPSTLGKLTALFQVRAMRLRLWAQEQFAEKAVQNLMDVALKGAINASISMVNHTIGTPLALPPVAANKREDSVAAIERRGAQLRAKLDAAATGRPSGISAESD